MTEELYSLLRCVNPEDWERIWNTTGARDRYRIQLGLSVTSIELLIRHLADPA